MIKSFLCFISIFFIFNLFGCQNSKTNTKENDSNSYINDFELVQQNINNESLIKITSPKAIIDPRNNDIEIFDSSIEILNKMGQDVRLKSGNAYLDNSMNIIKAYNNVNITLIKNIDSFINTDSFEWDLNTSYVNLKSPLNINFRNTVINSSNGSYDIDLSELKINNSVFNRSIFNKYGEKIYNIKIIADKAKWLKNNNSLEFQSVKRQVETTINFLNNE